MSPRGEAVTIAGMSALTRTLCSAALALALAACESAREPLDAIRARGELRLITRNGPSTYYLGRDRAQGYEYDLAAALADELGVTLRVQQAFTLEALFAALDRGEADIAGAGLTLTPERARTYTASAPYAQQQPQVIYKAGERRPRRPGDLAGLKILAINGSSHEDLLGQLSEAGKTPLAWQSVPSSDPLELLQAVDAGAADVAIVNSRDFAIQQNLVPRLKRAFDLAAPRDIVWYLPARVKDSELIARVNEFLQRQSREGFLEALQIRYFAQDENITRIDSQTFVYRVRRDLGTYRPLIELVAREQGLPWELLAAISYQESHWDPQATSRTGVRGMMMLTRATARELGVTQRTDAAQSLRGGARYFSALRRRLADDILEPDRSWLALAAYNIGRAHLEDARILTERRGGDPHLWADVMAALPLLQEPAHYKTLRHGYARGREAVRYVQNIRHYYKILRWQSAREQAPRPPAEVAPLTPEALRRLRLLAL